jgi:short subunit dehydrogenase-like uncharacterized protein
VERLELTAAASGVPNAPIIVADVKDETSLRAMARQARVLINTVGPFRYYGQPVVEACIAEKTDYLDVSGEPEFIERIALNCDDDAKAAGVFVASAVGFDSVPGDVGALWTAQQFRPPARCTNIETFIFLKAGPSGFRGHFPTFESAVQGFASAKELAALRKRAIQAGKRPKVTIPGPKPAIDLKPQYDSRVGLYRVPFLGSDASVIRRTAASLATIGKPAYNCAVYLTLPSRWALFLYQLFGGVFAFLAKRAWGRTLLLRYPGLFSNGVFTHEGPSEQQISETTFEMVNLASGYSQGMPSSPNQAPDMKIKTRVVGPEPGYVACSIFVVAAATMLLESRNLLGVEPGVHTPAFLLHNVDYVARLRGRGIEIETCLD